MKFKSNQILFRIQSNWKPPKDKILKEWEAGERATTSRGCCWRPVRCAQAAAGFLSHRIRCRAAGHSRALRTLRLTGYRPVRVVVLVAHGHGRCSAKTRVPYRQNKGNQGKLEFLTNKGKQSQAQSNTGWGLGDDDEEYEEELLSRRPACSGGWRTAPGSSSRALASGEERNDSLGLEA
jgi:hypothetical protein